MLAANDQHLLALLNASNFAQPPTSTQTADVAVPPPSSSSRAASSKSTACAAPMANTSSAEWTGTVPSDFLRCNAALVQLKTALEVAKRCEDLTKSIKYANDDITSMAIASFSKTDLWKAMGYRGGPDDAKLHMRRQQLEAKGAAMRAAAILATTAGGSNSGAAQPLAAAKQTWTIDPAARLRQSTEQGGVLVDESSEALIGILGFLQELVDGKLVSSGVTRTPLDFPKAHVSPRSGRRRSSSSGDQAETSSPLSKLKATAGTKRPSQIKFSAEQSVNVDAPLIDATRQKELDVRLKYAHDRETRAACVDEERRFQRIVVLQVLSLVAMQQLEGDIAVAKQRLLTCEQLQHRADQNPHRALDDNDLQRCVALVPELLQTIAHANTQLATFEQKHRKRFHRALVEGVEELCAFNREVHCWNHHVEHRARRHRNAIRRSYQSCFTVLSKLENGELTLDKQPEIFVKLQLFEKLDSTITLARQAQELLLKYKRRLCALDKLPNDKIRDEDIARWQVDLKKPKRQAPSGKSGTSGSKRKSTTTSRRSSRGSATSSRTLSPQTNKPFSAAPAAGKRNLQAAAQSSSMGSRRGSAVSMCSSRNSNQTEGDATSAGGTKPAKRWRFKLFEEAHDEERMRQYDAIVDVESEALLETAKAILAFVTGPLVQMLLSSVPAPEPVDPLSTRLSVIDAELPTMSGRPSSTASVSSRRSTRQRLASYASNASASGPPNPPPLVAAAPASSAMPALPLAAPLPKPVGYFVSALLSSVAEVVACMQAEVAHWEDTDLMTGSDEDDEGGGGMGSLRANDPLNRSSSSSFAMSSTGASSMGDVPECHVPPCEAAEDAAGGRSAYLATLKRLLDVKQLLSDVAAQMHVAVRPYERPPPRAGASSTPQSLGAMFELPATQHDRSPSDGVMSGDVPSLSPQERAIMATIALDTVAPLPPTLAEVIEREAQLLILRPGELLGPRPAPPMSAFSAATTSSASRGGFIKTLQATLNDDAHRLEAQRSLSLSLATHAPFWHKPPPCPPQSARRHVVPAANPGGAHPSGVVAVAHPPSARPPTAKWGNLSRRTSLQPSDDLSWDVTRYDALRDEPPLALPHVYGRRLGDEATDDGAEGLFAPWAFSSATRSSRPGTAATGTVAAAHTAKVKEAKAKLVGARPTSTSKWTPQRPFH